ncbi:MAG: RluA family pseudouridine synthase [Deltaproteobacteria bacterium]|nr:RluA family pseudouridine synthase [Deltaproteobacteria bacterium]
MAHHYRAGSDAEGVTIETFLLKIVGLKPRAALKRAFTARHIRLNGRVADRLQILHRNDTIEINDAASGLHTPAQATLLPNAQLALEILTQTQEFIACAKAAGMNTHPLRPDDHTTVLNALIARFPETARPCRLDKPLEGTLLHRLDRGTSGVLLAARDTAAFELLRQHWSSAKFEKVYLAWVNGYVTQGGRLELQLYHDPKSTKRMVAIENSSEGRRAVTSFMPIKTVTLTNHEPVTLLLIRIHTGVMHQIRATFKALGHPVLCDPIYLQKTPTAAAGKFTLHRLDRDTDALLQRLHARVAPIGEPDPEAVPEQGFFLHALWLRSPEVPGLEQGITAPIPRYFG